MLDKYPDILTAEEVAELLRLNVRTVIKLANQGRLPFFKIANQYRFSKEKLKTWLDQSISRLSDNMLREIDTGRENDNLTLGSLLTIEHILCDLQTGDRNQTIRVLVTAAAKLGAVKDADQLYTKIIEREEQYSTGLGNGLALPHPRSIDKSVVTNNFVMIGTHHNGIDYSNDRKKTHIIILLAAPELSVHLKLVSHITRLFKPASLRNAVIESHSAEYILERIKQQEQKLSRDRMSNRT